MITMIKKITFLVFVPAFILAITLNYGYRKVSGTVENVRIVYETKTENGMTKSNFVSRIFFGTLLGNATGLPGVTVLGGIIGSTTGKNRTTIVTQPRLCQLFINIPGEGSIQITFDRYVSGPAYISNLKKCSLLQTGDRVNFYKEIRKNKTTRYTWTR